MTRRLALAAALLLLGAALSGCTSPDASAPLVAISAPGTGDDVWGVGVGALTSSLKHAGYRVEVRRAGDDIPTQNLQLSELIKLRPQVLVVAPVDGTSLGNRLDGADAVGIPVVVYDRLAYDTDGVDLFVGFDHELAGEQQAWSLLAGLGLTDEQGVPLPDAPAGPFSIELLASDLDDFATEPMFDGAMKVLRPYLAAGTLQVPSGITDAGNASPTHGDPAGAAARIRAELAKGVHLDAILSPDDPMSLAVIRVLPAASETPAPTPTPTPAATATPATIVTGCGAHPDSIAAILAGTQFSTLSEDPRALGRAVAAAVDAIASGRTPASTTTLDNSSSALVPAQLLAPVLVDASNANPSIEPGYCTRPGLAR